MEPKMEEGFTHIGLKKGTQRKIAILSKVIGPRIYELVAIWADNAWEQAKKAGMVTDDMLETTPAHWVGSDEEGLKRLMKKVNEKKPEGTKRMASSSRLTLPPPLS